MKRKLMTYALIVAGALAAPGLNCALAEGSSKPEPTQAELLAQAKITEVQASKIALTKAPGGVIQAKELEEENGHLIWSFDIATSGTKDITEVQVDAKTGAIVAVATETPKDQAKEAKADKKKEKGKGEKDEDDEKESK
jgi:hypothetical protein